MLSRNNTTKTEGPLLLPYTNGSLPKKVREFLEASSDTTAFKQRSHPHRSIINTYMVVTFLEEASESRQPLKRDAGLRDLAQRLHLWPGDVARELQRDALQATELLTNYVKESLATEVKFVDRVSTKEFEPLNDASLHRLRDMEATHNDVLNDLDSLKFELLAHIKDPQLFLPAAENELHDLAPFIPGFTSTKKTVMPKDIDQIDDRTKEPVLMEGQLAIKEKALITASEPELNKIETMSSLKLAALNAIDQYLEKAKIATRLYNDIISDDSLHDLSEHSSGMLEIQDAFEEMGNMIFDLLEAERKAEDYDLLEEDVFNR